MKNSISRLALAVAAVSVSAGVAMSESAAASGGDRAVERSGACTAGATWKLKAKHDDNLIEVEFEVDSNRVGQTWSVRLTDNGVVVFNGSRRTLAPSGSFSVERRIADRAGSDTLVAVASNAATGQRCSGSIRL